MLFKRLTYAIGIVFLSTWLVGIFLKFMYFEVAFTLIIVGSSGLAIIFLPMLFFSGYNRLIREVMSERSYH